MSSEVLFLKLFLLILLIVLTIGIGIWTMMVGWGLTITNGWVIFFGYTWAFLSPFLMNLIKP